MVAINARTADITKVITLGAESSNFIGFPPFTSPRIRQKEQLPQSSWSARYEHGEIPKIVRLASSMDMAGMDMTGTRLASTGTGALISMCVFAVTVTGPL